MLHHPGVVVAEPICQLHLGERVLVEPQLAVGLPGTRQLQLVENAELHLVSSRIVAPEAEHSRSRALLPMPAVQGGKAVLRCFTLSHRNGGRGEIYRRVSPPPSRCSARLDAMLWVVPAGFRGRSGAVPLRAADVLVSPSTQSRRRRTRTG